MRITYAIPCQNKEGGALVALNKLRAAMSYPVVRADSSSPRGFRHCRRNRPIHIHKITMVAF